MHISFIVKNFKRFLRHEKQQKEEQEWMGRKPHSSQHATYVERKGKKAYVSWEDNDIQSSDDEEEFNICLMENHQDDDVTSYFSYYDIFRICKKLTKETSKLKQIVSTSNDTISSLELKNKNLEKEIKILRERQNDSVQDSLTSNKEDEPNKCNKCDILLYFINEEVILPCFILLRKIMRAKKTSSFIFLQKKKYCEQKINNLFAPLNVYVSSIKKNEKNVYETNNNGSKMTWIPKVKT